MKTKTIQLTITKAQSEAFLETLALGKPSGQYKSDQVIHQATAQFDDGIEITIDIANGGHDDNSAPYVNSNWRDNGEDLYALGSEPDNLFGEYTMVYDKLNDNGIETETQYIVQFGIN